MGVLLSLAAIASVSIAEAIAETHHHKFVVCLLPLLRT